MPQPKVAKKKSLHLPITVPKDLHKKIVAKSRQTGISAAHIARQAWEEWVKDPAPSQS